MNSLSVDPMSPPVCPACVEMLKGGRTSDERLRGLLAKKFNLPTEDIMTTERERFIFRAAVELCEREVAAKYNEHKNREYKAREQGCSINEGHHKIRAEAVSEAVAALRAIKGKP